MTNLQTYLDFAKQTAWEAGRLTLGYFQAGVRPDFKADDSPVTVADREAEQLIRQEQPDRRQVALRVEDRQVPRPRHYWRGVWRYGRSG